MRPRSLAARLALIHQGMTLGVVVLFATSSLWLTAHVLKEQESRFLGDTASRLARVYDDELAELGDPARAATNVLTGESTPGVAVELIGSGGRLLARSTLRSPSRTPRGAMVSTATGTSGVVVRVSMTDSLRRASVQALAWSLAVSAIPLLALGLLLDRWVARRSLRPLATMADRAAEVPIEEGIRTLGEPTGLVEIDGLARSFDRLLERLDHALRAERRFAADASHELRTPLTVLSGELELARSRAGGNGGFDPNLARASEQVRAMRELVDAILLLHRSGAFPQLGAADFEPVNLSDVLRDVTAEAGSRYPKRERDLAVESPDEVLVSGHPTLLTSALGNLVDNAFKFTAVGEPVRIVVAEAAGTARVVVEDGGRGIPAYEQERIFDPFFRGAEARAGDSGFGLGLPILRRVARAHGGDVVVGSSALGGARFELALPTLARTAGTTGSPSTR